MTAIPFFLERSKLYEFLPLGGVTTLFKHPVKTAIRLRINLIIARSEQLDKERSILLVILVQIFCQNCDLRVENI